MDIQIRKQLFASFFTMLKHLPIRYTTLAYRKSEFKGEQAMPSRMKKGIANLMFENLKYLQRFLIYRFNDFNKLELELSFLIYKLLEFYK